MTEQEKEEQKTGMDSANPPNGDQAQQAPASSEGGDEIARLQADLEAARREAEGWKKKSDEWLDQYRRTLAEFSNYRKRQERDEQQRALRLNMDVMRQILPPLDDFGRALKSAPCNVEPGWMEGIKLIERRLYTILESFQVKAIDALGKPFDPNLHHAILQEDSSEYPAGTVMEELQKGYLLADQVLRPTMVKVSNGPGPQNAS